MKIPYTFKMNKENAFILILVGVLCMVVVWPVSEEKNESTHYDPGIRDEEKLAFDETGMSTGTLEFYVEKQEKRLCQILEQMDGVGKVHVMIRASASKEYVVEKDVVTHDNTVLETDSNGGSRKNQTQELSEASIYTKDDDGKDVPLVIKELEPEIEGVLVAAQGADSESLVSEITQAVQVLFDIPVHKIKVVKMKVD